MKKLMALFVAIIFAAAVFPPKHAAAARNQSKQIVINQNRPVVKPARYIPGRLLVKLSTTVQRDSKGFAVQSLGAVKSQVLEDFRADMGILSFPRALFDINQHDGWYLIEIPKGDEEAFVAKLQADRRVLGVQYDQEVQLCQEPFSMTPNDPLYVNFPYQWNLQRISMPFAWGLMSSLQITGEPVRIAVIDSGLDYNHIDLVGRVWTNPGEIPGDGIDNDNDGVIDDVHGAHFVNGVVTGEPFDTGAHGTTVSGIADAVTNNGIGVASVAGMSNVQIVPVCVIAPGMATADLAGCFSAFGYVARIAHRANIKAMNVSLGFETITGVAMDDAMAMLHSQGVLACFAAGNFNNEVSNYGGVIDFPNVIVATGTDENDHVVFNYSPLALAAPGRNLSTTYPGNQYAGSSGTSDSAPQVAAVAALLGTYRPSLDNPRLVKDQLFKTSSMQGQLSAPVQTTELGAYGLLDVNSALQGHPDLGPIETVGIRSVAAYSDGLIVIKYDFSGPDRRTLRLFGASFSKVKIKAAKIKTYFLGGAPSEIVLIDMKSGGFATAPVQVIQ